MTKLSYLLRPHWPQLTLAFVAVVGESVTGLLEPWPLKIVFDNVLGSKRLPDWLAQLVQATTGTNKLAILSFVVVMVLAIAVVGAVSTYFEKYLTNIGGPMGFSRPASHSLQPYSKAVALVPLTTSALVI